MNQQTYIKKAARKLHCNKEKKNDFTKQLASDITSAIESGESWEAVQKRLGTPMEIASEMNESLGEADIAHQTKTKLVLFICLAIVVIAILIGIFIAFLGSGKKSKSSVGSEDTATNETLSDQAAISLSEEVITQFNQDNYNGIILRGDTQVKKILTADVLQQSKEQVMPNAGAFEQIESSTTIRTTENGLSYTTVQTKVRYAKQTIIFTISWNDKKQLCGFYLK